MPKRTRLFDRARLLKGAWFLDAVRRVPRTALLGSVGLLGALAVVLSSICA
jgi:hypothetical protein